MKILFSRIILMGLLTIGFGLHGKERLILGGNFNEHSQMIRWELLKQSETRVVRGFIPAAPFIRGQRQLKTDPAVQNLKKAATDGYKVILCLKWDFKARDWQVPEAASDLEQQCFFWVDDLILEVGDIFVLETINEVMVDTQDADLRPDNSGNIPMVVFQRRLVDHLFKNGNPPPIYMGGFTRLDRETMQSHPITVAMMEWINSDKRITGTNFHIHAPEMEIFDQALGFIRERIPDKPFIVTEFSLVWKYKRALGHPLGRFVKGKQFASKYKYDPEISVRDYINKAIDNPVPEEEWTAFLQSQYWYVPDFLERACEVMNKYGVACATYAFQQGSSGRGKLGPDSNPWILNPLYLPSSATRNDGKTAVNQDFMRAYRKWR